MVKPPETPQEFLTLTLDQQTDRIARMYISKCTTIEFVKFSPKKNRKVICGQYHALRKFLKKNKDQLVLLYSYLYSLPLGELMDLSEAYRRAAEYNQRMKLESDREKAKGAEEYDSYESILKEMMGT